MRLIDAECRWADEVHAARHGNFFDVAGAAPENAEEILFETEAQEFRTALAQNNIEPVRDRVDLYAARLGLQLHPGSLDERIIGRAILRTFAEASARAANEFRARHHSSEGVDDKRLAESGSPSTEPPVVAQSTPTECPELANRFAGLTIEKLWPSFADDCVATKRWRPSIAAQSYGTARAWVKAIGDTPPEKLTSGPAAEFQRIMVRLPGAYAKRKDLRGLCFAEILKRVEGTDYKRLAFTTWNRHASVMSAFWEWAARNELLQASKNPFDGLWIETNETTSVMDGGSAVRPMWSDTQLIILFQSPLFVGCKSKFRRHLPGDLLIRDPLYWCVLIAALTGMRREEICSLRVRHVETDPQTDIVFFNLKALDLKLKNPDSRRWIPLHKSLLALGFVDLRIRDRPLDEHVFPELLGKGAFGDKVGKAFVRYRKNRGIYAQLLDLHAFRHTVSTLLVRAGVPQAHAEEVTGHRSDARRTTFARYDKGATLSLLKEAIDRLELPLTEVLRAAARNPASGHAAEGKPIATLPSRPTTEVPI